MGIDKFIERVCVQTAVYWGNPVSDGEGQNTYDDPVEISCRWDGAVQLDTNVGTTDTGELVFVKAVVLVTQDLNERGWLYLGSLDDFDSTVDTSKPETIEGAYQIKAFQKNPMIKSTTIFVRKAILM